MFELEKEIVNWKDAIEDNRAISVDERLELESHLRESIVALRSQSLSEQESFWVATNRLGHPAALQEEFVKNDPARRWRYRLFWMLVGFLSLKTVGSAAAAITAIVGTAMATVGFAGSVSGVTMSVVMFSLWICAFAIGFRERQQLRGTGESLPLWCVVTLGAMLLVAPAIGTLARIAQYRLVTPTWLSEAAIYSSVGGLVLNFCILAFCFTMLWNLNDRDARIFD